jgi:RNA polymerase sigma factor (TIGR02999 family)
VNPPKSEETIFAEALRLPSGQRAAYVQRVTDGDPELRQDLDSPILEHIQHLDSRSERLMWGTNSRRAWEAHCVAIASVTHLPPACCLFFAFRAPPVLLSEVLSMNDVTRILASIEDRNAGAAEQLLPLVYDELRRLASARMANELPGQTLQPTALVHEAWLRLVSGESDHRFANRGHFFAAAAEAMRRILIERARRKLASKRGGRADRVNLDDVEIAIHADDDTLLLVNEALEKLKVEDSRAAELVSLRFFGGLKLEDAGQILGISERTAKRSWAFARAWLYDELNAAMKS